MNDRPAYGEGLTGWAVSNRTPVWTNRADLDPRTHVIPGHAERARGADRRAADRAGRRQGRAEHLPARRRRRSSSEHEFELAKWFGDAAALALDNAQIRAAARASRADGLADRALQPPLLPRATPRRADPGVALARLGRRADVRPRRLQAGQRRLRPRAGDELLDRARAGRARDRARLRRRLPDRRRGVRRDHAVLRRRRRARTGRAPRRARSRGRSSSRPAA